MRARRTLTESFPTPKQVLFHCFTNTKFLLQMENDVVPSKVNALSSGKHMRKCWVQLAKIVFKNCELISQHREIVFAELSRISVWVRFTFERFIVRDTKTSPPSFCCQGQIYQAHKHPGHSPKSDRIKPLRKFLQSEDFLFRGQTIKAIFRAVRAPLTKTKFRCLEKRTINVPPDKIDPCHLFQEVFSQENPDRVLFCCSNLPRSIDLPSDGEPSDCSCYQRHNPGAKIPGETYPVRRIAFLDCCQKRPHPEWKQKQSSRHSYKEDDRYKGRRRKAFSHGEKMPLHRSFVERVAA